MVGIKFSYVVYLILIIDHVVRLPSAHPNGSTSTHSQSNPEMTPIPAHTPLVGENYGALVSEGCTVGSIGPMHYSILSDADIDATFNSFFINSTF